MRKGWDRIAENQLLISYMSMDKAIEEGRNVHSKKQGRNNTMRMVVK